MATRAKRISDSILRRYLAGESVRSLAPDSKMTHQALGKRLRTDDAIQKRLATLNRDTEQPQSDTPAAGQGKPSPVKREASAGQAAQAEPFALPLGESRRGRSERGTRTSFSYGGEGRARVGYLGSRRGSALDQVAAEHAGRVRISDGKGRIMLIDERNADRYRAKGWR